MDKQLNNQSTQDEPDEKISHFKKYRKNIFMWIVSLMVYNIITNGFPRIDLLLSFNIEYVVREFFEILPISLISLAVARIFYKKGEDYKKVYNYATGIVIILAVGNIAMNL